jgi:uncharacterized cupin superfamily protein
MVLRAGELMPAEARLEAVESGLAPVTDGWFVINVRDAAWLANDAFGARCIFESDPRIVRGRPDLEPRRFAEVGIALAVIEPGRPSTLYHAESNQEGFLVLAGECVLLVEGEERHLHAWDFVHCPAGTEHSFVGAGHGPCVLLMIGARRGEKRIVYPQADVARRHGAGVEVEASSPAEAYAPFPHWQRGRPAQWAVLPWA